MPSLEADALYGKKFAIVIGHRQNSLAALILVIDFNITSNSLPSYENK